MRKQTLTIVIILICVSVLVAFLVFDSMEKKREALLEAERKELFTLWDQTEVYMSIEDFLKLYPEAIRLTSRSSGSLDYYRLSSPRIIIDNPYIVDFEFSDNTLDKVTLRLEDKEAESFRLPDFGYNLYQYLVYIYGTPSRSYSEGDFSKKRLVSCTWNHNLAKITLNSFYNSKTPYLSISYTVNHELINAYLAQHDL